jgi:hypothetical protein
VDEGMKSDVNVSRAQILDDLAVRRFFFILN